MSKKNSFIVVIMDVYCLGFNRGLNNVISVFSNLLHNIVYFFFYFSCFAIFYFPLPLIFLWALRKISLWIKKEFKEKPSLERK